MTLWAAECLQYAVEPFIHYINNPYSTEVRMDYIEIHYPEHMVAIRRKDLLVNATHILAAAGKYRSNLTELRKSADFPHIVIAGYPKY